MGRFEINGFRDLAVEIDEIANQFEEMVDKHETNTAYDAMEDGVSKAFDDVVRDAKERAKRHVPEDEAEKIHHESRGWLGDEYRHDMEADSVIVASHEFGSGLESLKGRGTVDVPGRGYFIPKPLSKGPIRLENHPADSDANPIIVEYVIHPGVEPKRFMHQALMENEDVIQGHVGNELWQMLKERGFT